MRFKNVNNTVFDLIVNEDDGFVDHSPEMINDSMILFTNQPTDDDPYTYPEEGRQYFPIGYSLESTGPAGSFKGDTHTFGDGSTIYHEFIWDSVRKGNISTITGKVVVRSNNIDSPITQSCKINITPVNSDKIPKVFDMETYEHWGTTDNTDDGSTIVDEFTFDILHDNMTDKANFTVCIKSSIADMEYEGNEAKDISVDKVDNGKIRIVLDNDFYYGKPLKVAYKNRYQHHAFKVKADGDHTQYYIDLSNKFDFCNDYSKYLLFYNGRKLDSELYRAVLPVRSTTPFYEFKLYFSIPVSEGDRFDIIYCPTLMKDIVAKPEEIQARDENGNLLYIDIDGNETTKEEDNGIINIPKMEPGYSGNIIVDKSILNYGLGNELYMVWINGKKIPQSNIVDIDSNYMRIISDEKSTRNLCITKYISDIDILIEGYTSQSSIWDEIISKLQEDGQEQIYSLLGINPDNLTNQEPDMREGSVDIKTIMYELVREQYLMNPRVDVTEAFVYDYLDVDTSIVEDTDTNGNVILFVADANKTDRLNGTPWAIKVSQDGTAQATQLVEEDINDE